MTFDTIYCLTHKQIDVACFHNFSILPLLQYFFKLSNGLETEIFQSCLKIKSNLQFAGEN